MSSNWYNFWQFNPNHPGYYQPPPSYYGNPGYYQPPPSYYSNPGYYQPPPSYYGSRDPHWYEDPHFRNFYAPTTNYYMGYNHETTSGYIDDPFRINSLNRHSYNGQSSGNFINDVYLTNERGFIDHHQAQANNHYVSRNIGDHYLGPHNLNHHTYNNEPTGEFTNVTTESEVIDVSDFDYSDGDETEDVSDFDLLQYLVVNYVPVEGNEYEVTEEIIGNMMKTTTHCGTGDRGEICVICQCKYENDETIGTLKCKHEYHANCINEWLQQGKRSCPICRSSVLPS